MVGILAGANAPAPKARVTTHRQPLVKEITRHARKRERETVAMLTASQDLHEDMMLGDVSDTLTSSTSEDELTQENPFSPSQKKKKRKTRRS